VLSQNVRINQEKRAVRIYKTGVPISSMEANRTFRGHRGVQGQQLCKGPEKIMFGPEPEARALGNIPPKKGKEN
jgi:hypothetical protein